ncbi:hypothetical protein WI72_09600 [Burkholderia ubonensis]|uniref:DUF1413 domain-containing protein n=1 Tax=Burkholderia ubonensis TaxID=101571 RepID=UPI000756B101|nr:DUF1413 domain-containing protein [Burkholderia ubonensis]KVC62691.1 hypothetical protein WI72_09600 [Burkholderia ubonensis]
MVKLFVEIDDALLCRALTDSQEQEISLDTFISEALNAALASPNPVPARKAMNVDDLIASTIDRVRKKEIGAEFMLVDLCTDEDWDALSGGERKSLGKGFRKAVEGVVPPIAVYVRRTSSNKAVYRRI